MEKKVSNLVEEARSKKEKEKEMMKKELPPKIFKAHSNFKDGDVVVKLKKATEKGVKKFKADQLSTLL